MPAPDINKTVTAVAGATGKGITINTDNATGDAFGRLRISPPETLFDSKQINDNQPLFWDDQETSGGSTTSVYSSNKASSTLGVALNTSGKRVRQTFQRFNYQPGKSQLVLLTGTLGSSGGGTGITRSIGIFNDSNGIFLSDDEGTLKIVIRSNVSGSPVDTAIAQSSWNLDKMNGTGPSGITLDITKSMILVIDYEWLGVGRVRVGMNINGVTYYMHNFLHANVLEGVYMSTPNLPLRYEIENDGTGAASELEHICSSVISEGGAQDTGIIRSTSTAGTHLDANTADTLYALIGIRLKAAYLSAIIRSIAFSVIVETNDDFEWALILNPIVASTFTYSDETNSAVQSAKGATANTVTGGTWLYSGFSKSSAPVSDLIPQARWLGANIANTPDTLVLCVRPLAINEDFQGSITWRELS